MDSCNGIVHKRENRTMETSTHLTTTIRQSIPDLVASRKFLVPFNTFLEYAGAALGIIGWLGVRQIGSPQAQELGFLLWVIGGLTLVAWGWHTKARGIIAINLVNTAMAASALLALV
jgi:hypothetical protein